MSTEQSIEVVLEAFRAVERRDEARQSELFHPDVEFYWPPSLAEAFPGRSYEDIWDALQPTDQERALSPRVVAASDDEVVVNFRQRGDQPERRAVRGRGRRPLSCSRRQVRPRADVLLRYRSRTEVSEGRSDADARMTD